MIYDETMKGFLVIARKFIARGEGVSIPALRPNNDYMLLKKGYINPTRETAVPIFVKLDP